MTMPTVRPEDQVDALAFSPDGSRLVSMCCRFSAVASLWDTTTWKDLGTFRPGDQPTGVTFSPDGGLLAFVTERGLKLWDVATQKEVATLAGYARSINTMAFGADGKTLVTGSDDHTVRVWDVRTRQELAALTVDGRRVKSVAFSPSGKILAAGNDFGVVKLFVAATDEEVAAQRSK